MKKKLLLLPLFAIGLGTVVFNQTTNRVRAEEVEEETEKSVSEVLEEKYATIRDTQVLGTTIGALVGGVGSMAVSLAFCFVNKSNLKNLKENVVRGEKTLSEGFNEARQITTSNAQTREEVRELLLKVNELSENNAVVSTLNKELTKRIEKVEKNRKEEIECLLAIIGTSAELVANGTAEKLNNLYHKE